MSTNPNGRQSGLNAVPVSCLTTGTKIFAKAVDPKLTMATTAAEVGDTLRFIKNMDAANTVLIAETQAKTQSAATSWPLGPGETMTVLGPAGFGWGGDLYGAGVGGAVSVAVFSA